ncbi:MAG: response regulator [Deltaproteobacteria bacterium]|nr:response regulator [Deltaproteobacteria bacterium]
MLKHILIVDDEPNIIIPLQYLMEQTGYSVVVAQSGEEALESISGYKPDLVLLDINLPGIDGYKVCEIIKFNPEWNEIKVIFLSANSNDWDVVKGIALGAIEFIEKPFSNQQVIKNVKYWLGDSE